MITRSLLNPLFVRIKKQLLMLSGRYDHLKKGIKCKYAWYGNSYGGFFACPENLNSRSIVYSVGIGRDISFDNAMINKHECMVFGFDPTPGSIEWVKNNAMPSSFKFFPFGLGNRDSTEKFYLPRNPGEISGSIVKQSNVTTNQFEMVEIRSLETIASNFGHTSIDVLKMDIEGSEYDVIDSIISSKVTIHQILIEFHDRLFPDGYEKTREAILKLNDAGYKVFAVSNNLQEVSLVKR